MVGVKILADFVIITKVTIIELELGCFGIAYFVPNDFGDYHFSIFLKILMQQN